MEKTVAIVGASNDHAKYGNKAVRAYRDQGWKVYPVNPNYQEVEGLHCYPRLADVPGRLQRVSIYVPPMVTRGLLEDLVDRQHQELWFNPGSATEEIIKEARQLGLNPIEGCSIIDVGMSPAKYA